MVAADSGGAMPNLFKNLHLTWVADAAGACLESGSLVSSHDDDAEEESEMDRVEVLEASSESFRSNLNSGTCCLRSAGDRAHRLRPST